MSARLGLHVERASLRGIAVEGQRVVGQWECEVEMDGWQPALSELFATLRRERVVVRSSVAALGAGLSRTKVLFGLPSLPAKDLEAMVRSNASRFFVGDVAGQVIAVRHAAGGAIADAYDRVAVQTLAQVAQQHHVRRLIVTSTRTIAMHTLGSGDACPPGFEIALAACHLPELPAGPAYEALGAEGAPVSRRRATAACAAVSAAILVLLAAPVVSFRLAGRHAERELAAIAAPYAAAMAVRESRTRADQLHRDVSSFTDRARSPGIALARIAAALPDSAALVSIAMDSAGANLVVVSQRAVDVLASLDTVRAFVAPQLTGPITRERVATGELERAAIRFAWSRR